jgi:ATP-binding cassette subfamily B protein
VGPATRWSQNGFRSADSYFAVITTAHSQDAAFRHLVRPGRFIWHYVLQHRLGFSVLAAAVISASACAIAAQYQMKLLVDGMSAERHVAAVVWAPFGVFIGLLGLESLLLRLSAILTCRLTIRIGVTIRFDLFTYLSGQSIRYFANNLAGSLGQRITGSAGNCGALVNTSVWRLAPPLIDFAGALAIFALIDSWMAVAMGGYVATVTTILILVGNRGRPTHTAYFRQASQIAGDLIDVISNMWTVKAFSAQRREAQRLRQGFEREASAQQRSWLYLEKTRIGYDFLLWIMSASMLLWALHSWQHNEITAGDVVVISALSFRVLHGARELALALVDVSQQLGYIEDTLQAVGKAHTIMDTRRATARVPQRGAIEFRDVCFAYEHQRVILPRINFRIAHGERVGIVGPSGAGKSTILQLIQRLYDVQRGEILIDDKPVNGFSQNALRSALAVVPQEISLFHRSVMENIRFARADATDADVIAAANAARCAEFIRALPQGYDTVVGERGVKLSGGQRQRIGIARALLKAAPILLLDEATSALDSALEIEIQESIRRELGACTVIAVAHRLSTLASFDRVFVMDNGSIIEEGSPADLRRRSTMFNHLWGLQTHGLQAPAIIRLPTRQL